MKSILLIATGGTIASGKTKSGLAPQLDSVQILSHVPSVRYMCQIDTVQPMNIDSTNIQPADWLNIARCIEDNYGKYAGFVILHGTDTMSYTAAALSYLIQNIKQPVIITGAQRPIDQEVTDAKLNLTDSILCAIDDNLSGVNIVFDGHIIAGTRARKIRTKSFNAFSSINFPDIGVIRNGKILHYIKAEPITGEPRFYRQLSSEIFLLKLIPGMDTRIFTFLKEHYHVLIIESFGVGGLPCNQVDCFMSAVEEWLESGRTLVMTTQVHHEGSDMSIYQVGQQIKEKHDVLEAYNMTLESALTKLMWARTQTKSRDKLKELFYTPVNYDLII